MKSEAIQDRTLPLMSRRGFLAVSAASVAAVATGCATSPTGRHQLNFVSEQEERALDQRWAPQQFSADYGAVQDASLNSYVSEVGMGMARLCHRPSMPYSFRVLNTSVVNGYTMPAGSVGLARGLLLSMKNESELAAVLGHEIGHVSARHAGARMSKGIVGSLAVAGIAAYVGTRSEKYAALAAGLGGIGAGVLLSRYSRDDEREADALGLQYMTKANHNPQGMIGIMDSFRKLEKEKPGVVTLLFSTHPMSRERYDTAVSETGGRYAFAREYPVGAERFMDQTAKLRARRGAVEKIQDGEKAILAEKYGDAAAFLSEALRLAPGDYGGLLVMAKCCLAQGKNGDAERFASEARSVYPAEPQAIHVAGMAKLKAKRYDEALADFEAYEQKLPGNANTVFFKGLCHENAGRREKAATEYLRYVGAESNGEFSSHARQRLTEWGYIRPAA